MKDRKGWVTLTFLLAVVLGCSGAPPPPTTLPDTRGRMAGMNPQEAYTYLERTAQPGDAVGDVATPEQQMTFTIQAESIVVGLGGRGTKRIPPELKADLIKLLVKAYDSPIVARQVIESKDAAPVRCTAELPSLAKRDDKIDLVLQAYDATVNLEGGTLVDTPMVRYVSMPGPTHRGFRTRSGLVSAGTQAYARGDVTLNPGYREGEPLKPEVPHVAYIPAGVLVDKTWGHRLILKKPDASTALLIEAAVRRRFGEVATAPSTGFVAVAKPNLYRGYEKRYLDAVLRIRLRLAPRNTRLAHIEKLASTLGSSSPATRYDAECTLEAYGREAAPALLSIVRGSNVVTRQSALRVLAFVRDKRAVDPLIAESRVARGVFRAELPTLMSFVGGEAIEQRLTEMLTDDDPITRYRAVLALEHLGDKDAPIRNYFSASGKNFIVHLVDTPGVKFVVIKSPGGVRRIALFGSGITLKAGFTSSVGPIEITVGRDTTEIRHKRVSGPEPFTLRTLELQNLITALDRLGVSIHDIVGLMAEMDRKQALNAQLYWIE